METERGNGQEQEETTMMMMIIVTRAAVVVGLQWDSFYGIDKRNSSESCLYVSFFCFFK